MESMFPFFADLVDAQYIEHDCYMLLTSIMSRMLLYYTPEASILSSTDRMERKLNNIQNSLLNSVDKEITIHLNVYRYCSCSSIA